MQRLRDYFRALTPLSTIALLTPRETAKHLRCTERTLERHRLIGDGPPFVKIGALVRYPLSELEKWLADRLRLSTSEGTAPPDRHTEPSLFAAEQGLHGVAQRGAAPLSSLPKRRSRRKNQRAVSRRKNQMDVRKYMGNVFLKVDHVKATGPIRVTIIGVSEGQYGKPDLAFHDGSQLSLNATNCRTLAPAYGFESDDWIGKEVELTVGEIQYQGQPQEAILIKPISPPIENKEPAKNPDLDDEF
jgi:hypothetical protein